MSAFLRQKSAGRWAIHSPDENCQFAQYALRHVHQWAEHCPAPAIELVIFNCGLWDVLRMFGDDPLTPPEVYTLMLTRLNRRLRLLFPQAKLLFSDLHAHPGGPVHRALPSEKRRYPPV